MEPAPLSVLHLGDVAQEDAITVLDEIMRNLGFGRDVGFALGGHGPSDLPDVELLVRKQPLFLLSDRIGDWTVLLPAHMPTVANAPGAERVARLLSGAFDTPVLLLELDAAAGFSFRVVDHGEAVLFHTASEGADPEALLPFAPEGVDVDRLRQGLASGGTPAERMLRFARAMNLQGELKDYPFADWRASRAVPWVRFVALSYFHNPPKETRRRGPPHGPARA